VQTPAPGSTPSTRHARIVLAIASMAFFLITLDISIVNVALANIRHDLDGGTTLQQWVIDGYTLLFAALLLCAGTVSDRIGAKKAISVGIVIFGLASVACSAAPDAAALIIARCVQGAGAAIMLPASMALIREAYPDPRRRASALGVWAVGGAVAALIGQPLGGLLTTLDWRWVFGINIPVCIGMLVFLTAVAPSATRPVRFDWLGQVLAVVALTALVFGLIEGGHTSFGSVPVLLALLIAVLGLVAFVQVQARVSHPMMPLPLFRARGLRLALPVGFAFMVGNYGNVFVVSLYLQQELGLSPLRAGLAFLPSAGFAIAGNLTSASITNRFGPRVPVVLGLLSMTAGMLALIATAALRSPIATTLCMIPIGAGGSMAMPAVTGLVLTGVHGHLAGTASAIFNTFRQVGGAVAIAVFGALIASPHLFITGMRISLTIAASLLLLAAASSLRIRPDEGAVNAQSGA
jgi:DHA2 family methylenomycin A resistance protein-like MFS transporter